MYFTNFVPLLNDGSFVLKFQSPPKLIFKDGWHLIMTRQFERNSGLAKFIFITTPRDLRFADCSRVTIRSLRRRTPYQLLSRNAFKPS
ncbi:MAG: hypothetical protein DMF72_18020 [Acidobacteria bacterium]|nr:MAG: hypothetical protein DMF72_18020 [Acidobacteriota bacterium]